AEDGIRDRTVTGVQTCALPIWWRPTAVLPEPIGPMRNTLVLPSMRPDRIPNRRRGRGYPQNAAAARRRPQASAQDPGASVVDVHSLTHDLRGNEDHQLVLVVLVDGVHNPEDREIGRAHV